MILIDIMYLFFLSLRTKRERAERNSVQASRFQKLVDKFPESSRAGQWSDTMENLINLNIQGYFKDKNVIAGIIILDLEKAT